MGRERLAAFSDGVFAILITVLVLDLKAPAGGDWGALAALLPVFLGYMLSFIYLAIYWNNHHHMLHTVTAVNGWILWANMHLLFWLSLLPFTTAWMGEHSHQSIPTALYGINLLMPALAYYFLQQAIIRSQGAASVLKRAIGRDVKGKISPLLYAAALPLAFVDPLIAQILYSGVALLWLCPDRRIERVLIEGRTHE